MSWTAPTTNTDGSPLTDLAGYKIYWGEQSGVYANSVDIPDPLALSHSLQFPDDGKTYYFVATAYNVAAVESVFSNETSKSMPSVATTPDPPVDVSEGGVVAIYSLAETDFSGTPVIAGTFSTAGQALTIEFEITPRTLGGDDRIISKAIGTAANDHWFMVSMSSGRLRFRLKTNGVTDTLLGNAAIPLNTKTVGKALYDGQNMSIFVNGLLDSSKAKSGNMDISNTAEVWVGGNPPNNASPFDGLIAVTVR